MRRYTIGVLLLFSGIVGFLFAIYAFGFLAVGSVLGVLAAGWGGVQMLQPYSDNHIN